ncbi:uncharacterized protein RJT20DRAFT_144943 [Scheffersomyces xylosifermentans]|uniref:uncharacterized protein n=1 Tax=Scheffersomyces xylosifermentans TaxID=1304137 RepID=UPI00315DB0A7
MPMNNQTHNISKASPAISITPSNGNSSLKSRSRAGTLPSSFLNTPSSAFPFPNNTSTISGSISNSASPLVGGQTHDNLGLPTMESISLGVSGFSPSPSMHAIDIPAGNGSSGNTHNNSHSNLPSSSRRIRSGSLFSTNSIWNDDAMSVHSSSQHSNGLLDNNSLHSFDINGNGNGNGNSFNGSSLNNGLTSNGNSNGTNENDDFISPLLSAQNSTANNGSVGANNTSTLPSSAANRNRSYTTTAAIPNMNMLPMSANGPFGGEGLNSSRLSTSPFVNVSNKTNDMNYLLDNLMLNLGGPGNNLANIASNTARHRSQTYSGTTPTIPESSLHQPQLLGSNVYGQQQQIQQQIHTQHGRQLNPSQHGQQLNPQHLQEQQFSQYSGEQPFLLNDFDFSQLVITTNFENPSLGPTKVILFDNLPQFIDAYKLCNILNNSLGNQRSLGGVRSIRLTGTATSKLALVECSSVEIAMALKASFNHLELIPGVILYVAFAKIVEPTMPGSASTPSPVGSAIVSNTGPVVQDIASGSANSSTANNGNHTSTSVTNTNTNNSTNSTNKSAVESSKPSPTDLIAIQKSLVHSISKLSTKANFVDLNKIVSIINKSIAYSNDNYQNNFGPLPDPIPLRQFDSPKLRELRKILENNENALSNKFPSSSPPAAHADSDDGSNGGEYSNKVMTQLELEELCLAMLDELPELCYDYLGNTIVQKLFTLVESPLIKLMMVKEITPFLTQLSIHKNGTWAIQKIINLSGNEYQQKYLIAASLKPYSVKLFNDQFGNYVLQGCIKFGSPFNDFVFETMLDNFIEISFGRFGARCIRTILETANESNVITNEQVVLVAGLIVEFANELVVNNNGSLLITWFLDTFNDKGSTIDDRFELLTYKFLPNLGKLCTHKLANLTILKILNNRSDLKSKQVIMDAIFGRFDEYEITGADNGDESSRPPSKLLELILSENPDNAAGPLFIYKILTNPLLLTLNDSVSGGNEFDPHRTSRYQQFVVSQIRRILLELNISNFQPYKKLMDEAGLSSNRLNRTSSMTGSGRRNKRNGNNSRSSNGQNPPANSKNPIENPNSTNQGMVNPMAYGVPQQYFMPAQQYQQQPQQVQPSNYPVILPQMMMGQGIPPQGSQIMPQQQYQRGAMPPHLMNQNQIPTAQQQQMYQQQQQQDIAVMQQLEQLSLSSAALGYNSNPGTPGVGSSQKSSFF